ncbi:MAG: hypothetical protein SVZ03_06735 [Spirochaetota bacterium]|nr:hypothetical protein [Spirochaetota bacterium]
MIEVKRNKGIFSDGGTSWFILEEVLREGAQKMLQAAIEQEVANFIEEHKYRKDDNGHRLAVRNGYMPMRDIITGLGAIKIKHE